MTLEACVVVPARDEEDTIAACLTALARQEGVRLEDVLVLLVLDGCTDGTEDAARAVARAHPGLRLQLLAGPALGVGRARKLGMDRAAGTLVAAGNARGLIACTDADSEVAPDWLRAQLDLVAAGADAIGGRIDVPALSPGLRRRRLERLQLRLAALRVAEPDAEHPHFSGASMAVTADAYIAVGGIEPLRTLEDEALERRLAAAGIAVLRSDAVRVRTSARLVGRAPGGLSADLAHDERLERLRLALQPG